MSADASIDARLREIEDRNALHDLIARYSRALDDFDLDALMALFTEDYQVDHVDGSVAARGHDQVRSFYGNLIGSYSMSIHYPRSQLVEWIDGDRAGGWVVGHAEFARDDKFVVTALRYDDDYRRVDGRWRFAHRTHHFWYFVERDDLSAAAVTRDAVRWPPGPARPSHLPTSWPGGQRARDALARHAADPTSDSEGTP